MRNSPTCGIGASGDISPLRAPWWVAAVCPFRRPYWVYEEKYDGWRMLSYKRGQPVQPVSRPGCGTGRREADPVGPDAGGGEHLDMPAPGRFTALKLLGHETNESIMLFEETVPSGTKSLFHLHPDSDEVAWVRTPF